MRLRLGDVKNSLLIRERTKLIPSDPKFVELVNAAQQRLVESGSWWGTYRRMRICAYNGCITWPREVARVAGLNVCCDIIPVRNAWYEFQEHVAPPRPDCCDCRDSQMLDRGYTPTFADVAGANKKLRVYYSNECDIGKTVVIQGRDASNNVIRTQTGGIRIEGEPVVLASPYVETKAVFSKIDGIQKPETVGIIRLYEYDTETTIERLLAEYAPSELNPWYRRSFITHFPSPCCEPGNGDGCSKPLECEGTVVTCLVKLEPIPATVDSDWMVIENLNALSYEAGSILASLRNEETLSAALHANALRVLQEELTSHIGRQNHIINIQHQGTAHLDRVLAGFR